MFLPPQKHFLDRFGDPYYAKTGVLLGPNGSDGATLNPDESAARDGALTVVGTASISRSVTLFGQPTYAFSGGAAAVSYANASLFDIGNQAYTIEGWFRFLSSMATFHLMGKYTSSTGQRAYEVACTTGDLRLSHASVASAGAAGTVLIAPSVTWVLGTWYHIAADWDLSFYRLYLNGKAMGNAAGSIPPFNSTAKFAIGGQEDGAASMTGNVADVRFTIGQARYKTDVGFPVPTARFPRW